MKPTPHEHTDFGEPWVDLFPESQAQLHIYNRHIEVVRGRVCDLRKIACVNACVGMLNPEQEITKLRADNTELLERLADRTHSHTLASMRDVQTIQRQVVEIDALKEGIKVLSGSADKS